MWLYKSVSDINEREGRGTWLPGTTLGRGPIGSGQGLVSVATCNQNNVVSGTLFAGSTPVSPSSSSEAPPFLLFLLVLFDPFQRCGCGLVLSVSVHLLVSIFVLGLLRAGRYVNRTDRSHLPCVFFIARCQPLQLYLVSSLGLTIPTSFPFLQVISTPVSLLAIREG